MKVNRQVNSRYLKTDHLLISGHDIWTEDGRKFCRLYSLLFKLGVINTIKLVETLNAV